MAPKGSPGSSGQGREGGTERHWWTLFAVCGATFMLLVDITIVQVALPTMQRSLHASFSDLQWVISAYALSLAALILTQGALADKFGRKRIFVFGLTVFTLASAACGLSHTPAELIASRAVQGVGGAAMFATSLALIGQDFQGKARASAIAVWGATVGGAVAIGPLVGGALTSAFGWQWIFYVNVPVGVLTLLVSMRMVNMADPNARRLDWNGLLTFSGGLFLLILGLTRGNDDGWSSRKVVVTLTRGRAASGPVRDRRAAPEAAHVRPVALPQAFVHGCVGGDLLHRRGDVRPAAVPHPLPPERPGAVPAARW